MGKSALFNRIAGSRIAIVHDMPGVTRDRVSAEVEWKGRPFTLVDTGGIGLLRGEKSTDVIIQAAMDQVQLAIDAAQAIVFVVDVRDGVVALDLEVAARLRQSGRPVLVAFLTGEHVHLLETDAEAMVDRASQILKSIFGDKYRAQTSVHVTNWGTDPFSLGSYSTPTVGVTAEHYEQLAQPVGKRVLFAGEATYREHAGFVERAMGSGIREARRLLGREVDLQLNPS